MDYFQTVVAEYLRADRKCFINPEFTLFLEPRKFKKNEHWYADILSMHMKDHCAYLCEVTYSRSPTSLIRKLGAWRACWAAIYESLKRDAGLIEGWSVMPWVFVPADHVQLIKPELELLFPNEYKLKTLEETLPWKYCTWDRIENRHVVVETDN